MQTKAQQAGHDFSIGPYIERDSKGNEIYWEKSNGYWVKSEYDRNGNQTYFETSTGYWQNFEYDDKGNETYYEESTGFWVKREYDARGKVISTESGKKSLKKVVQ